MEAAIWSLACCRAGHGSLPSGGSFGDKGTMPHTDKTEVKTSPWRIVVVRWGKKGIVETRRGSAFAAKGIEKKEAWLRICPMRRRSRWPEFCHALCINSTAADKACCSNGFWEDKGVSCPMGCLGVDKTMASTMRESATSAKIRTIARIRERIIFMLLSNAGAHELRARVRGTPIVYAVPVG